MKSIDEMQSRILGQFKKASHGNPSEKRNQYIELAKKKKMEESSTIRKSDGTTFIGGFDKTTIEKIEAKQEIELARRENRIANAKANSNFHALILNALSPFIHLDRFNHETLAEFKGQTFELFENETSSVVLKIGRTLKSTLQVKFVVKYQKKYYRKGDNFDIDKEVVQDIKHLEETVNAKISYGDYFAFQKSMISVCSKLINRFNLIDANKQDQSNQDIWSFEF